MLQKGQKISLEYTVFLEDGTKIDTSIGGNPLVFVIGSNEVFPALEEALSPLKNGESKEIQLKPEEAYGPVLEDAFREVGLETIPEESRKEGCVVGIQDPKGGVYPVRIDAIHDQKAVLNFNHPLAGKALRFAVKVLSVD